MAIWATLSSTAFAEFGDAEALLHCQVTCKGVSGSFGYLAFKQHGGYEKIVGSWSDKGFTTNRAQYSEVNSKCMQVQYEVLHSYPLRDKIRLGFVNERHCVVKPWAYAWYNPFMAYEISVVQAVE